MHVITKRERRKACEPRAWMPAPRRRPNWQHYNQQVHLSQADRGCGIRIAPDDTRMLWEVAKSVAR